MRLLCVFLSALTLFLSSFPVCAYTSEHEQEQATCENDSNEEATDCDDCSPFLTCGTCTGFTLPFIDWYLSSFAEVSDIKHILFNQFFTGAYSFPIWQPPKSDF
jgi:hypothetical protein